MHLLSILLFSWLHAFHISKTEINYDTRSQSLQVTSHIFIDDLEDCLKKRGHDKLFIGTKKESPKVDSLLHVFFQKELQVTLVQVAPSQTYIGKELSDDLLALWVYIEIPVPGKKLDQVMINNTILLDLYDDQKNMVMIKKDQKLLEHLILDKNTTRTAALKFP